MIKKKKKTRKETKYRERNEVGYIEEMEKTNRGRRGAGGCWELGEREGRRCRDYHIMVARGRISCATT